MLNLFRYWFRVPWFCHYTITFGMLQTSIDSGVYDWEFHDTYVDRFVEWGTMRCKFATFSDFRKYQRFLKWYKKMKHISILERRQSELLDAIYHDYSNAHSS